MYNPGDGLYNILARDYAPLPERLEAVKARLLKLPHMLQAARDNLDNPPAVMTETAIKQNPGVINLVMDGLQPYLDEVPEMKDDFTTARSRAIAALDRHGSWLESDLLPRSNGDFRLGEDQVAQEAEVLALVRLDSRGNPGQRRARSGRDPRADVRNRPAPFPGLFRRPRRRHHRRQGRRHPPGAGAAGRRSSDQRDHRSPGPGRHGKDHRVRAEEKPGRRAGRSGGDHRHARAPARIRHRLLRFARAPGKERHHLLRHQPHARRTGRPNAPKPSTANTTTTCWRT